MILTTRHTRKGWAIYLGRRRYLTTTYTSKAKAEQRIRVENQWSAYDSQSHLSLKAG